MLRLLTGQLADLLAEPAENATTLCVVELLDAMLDNLREQFRLEEEQDYLADVLQQYPNWHPEVEHLRQQHSLLHNQLRDIRRRVAAAGDRPTVRYQTRRQLRDWINTYNEHERRETQLIQDAFTLETGAGE